ncbi:hypothetical protein [Nesterenkonia haasae]|uniref:hypothetical protein n=1 Tax=Nesterenkonia haasae TaxID=2587813 RepID=UPI0013919971|nr:hypothetical protein [Nesterenkonia haasae]NDK31183.1 hypothetical protein [Nesterenkonia haasae]
MSIHVRMEGLDAVVADLAAAPRQTASKLRPIMRKGGVQMKRKMADAFKGSRSFRQVGRSVDFDFIESSGFGIGHMEVEVGPNAHRNPAAALAGIAYFGGANGGGGTVPEPDQILEDEANTAVKFLADALGDVL